jgi:hypothetical protein
MKKKFEDPTAPKTQNPPYEPVDGKNEPFWDFRAPQYDQRHSCFIQAGTDYGTGFTQPVGHKSNPKSIVKALPINTVKMMECREKNKSS